jgi:four helix bundle protein
MAFDHERLEAYQVALDFFDIADGIVERLRRRRGRSALADQLARAALSVVNNLAEGAGRFSKPDKARFYTTAIGSATESAAMLDICLRRRIINAEDHQRGKQHLERIVAMLIKLSRAMHDADL